MKATTKIQKLQADNRSLNRELQHLYRSNTLWRTALLRVRTYIETHNQPTQEMTPVLKYIDRALLDDINEVLR